MGEVEGGSNKRQKTDHNEEDIDMAENIGAATGAQGSGGGTAPGAPILSIGHMGVHNKMHLKYRQRYRIWLDSYNWEKSITIVRPSDTAPAGNVDSKFYGYMHIIPWEALTNYLSPDEFTNLQQFTRWAKIKETKFQMRFVNFRNPFLANATTPEFANSMMSADFLVWRDFEQIDPFSVVAGDDKHRIVDYGEEIARIWGEQMTKLPASGTTSTYEIPATMGPRANKQRPYWHKRTVYNGVVPDTVPNNGIYFPSDEFSSNKMFKYACENFTHTAENYCINQEHRSKNGLIWQAPSAMSIAAQNDDSPSDTFNTSRIHRKQIYKLPIYSNNNTASIVPEDITEQFPPNLATSANLFYKEATVEGFNLQNTREDPPLHHLSSLMVGCVPQIADTTSANIIPGVAQFEITTECVVECELSHAIAMGDLQFQNPIHAPTSYITNDTDVVLHNRHKWRRAYNPGGKMLFGVTVSGQ